MAGNFPAVLNFDRSFLKLNRFICNYSMPVSPDHWTKAYWPPGSPSRAGRNAQWEHGELNPARPILKLALRQSPWARRLCAALSLRTHPPFHVLLWFLSLCPATPRSLAFSRHWWSHAISLNKKNPQQLSLSLPTETSQHFPQTLHWYPPCSNILNSWLIRDLFYFGFLRGLGGRGETEA